MQQIASQIKPITLAEAIADLNKLILKTNPKPESRVGNKFVDYFTFKERLATKTRKGMNFYEFILDTEYQARPYIKNLLMYQDGLNINELTKLYRIYSLHCGSVSVFKPLQAIEVYKQFNSKVAVLDPCAGWGGRLVGAVVSKVPHYIGIDLNANLKEPYEKMVAALLDISKDTKVSMHIGYDASVFNYSSYSYDMIVTSPPYFNIELYSCTNKKSKAQWIDSFYRPVFLHAWANLLADGWLVVNISVMIYETVFIEMFGNAHITIPMNNKVRPQCAVKEFIYCWQKCASAEVKGECL